LIAASCPSAIPFFRLPVLFLRYSDHLKALSTDAIDELGALDLHWLHGSHNREEERGKGEEDMFDLLRG